MHLDCAVKILNRNCIDGAIFFRPQELVMLANHYPHWNGSVLVSTCNGKHTLFVPDLEPELLDIESEIEVVYYPWATAVVDPWDGLLSCIEDVIGKGLSIAINTSLSQAAPSSNAGEGSIIPMSFFMALQENFKLTDVNDSLNELLSVKTEKQIEKIKLSHIVALPAIAEFFKIQAGNTDAELVAKIESKVTKQVGSNGVYYARAWATIQSGPEAKNAGRYNKTGNRAVKDGDWAFLEISVCVNGFWLDLTRTTVVGTPTQQQTKHFDYVYSAIQAALRLAKPGTSLSSLYHAAMQVFQDAGLPHCFTHGLGHGTGFAYHDPSLAINSANNTRLRPGQILTIEPALYGEEINGGVRIEENIVITDDGFEYLSVPQTKIKELA
ncbi:M24 family metallopeptidase [Aeromonas aquatilis]